MTSLFYSISSLFSIILVLNLLYFVKSSEFNTGLRREEFDDGNYVVEWTVDRERKIITFILNVKTIGFVGLGINSIGSMDGADIFIGGVGNDSKSYFGDYHGVGTVSPVLDESQNWNLISASEANGMTQLIVTRPLHSCDLNDVSITNDTQQIIWSYGASDDIKYHGTKRGSVQANILDPASQPEDISKYEKWDVTKNMLMPNESTMYWCTVHKQPEFSTVRNIVGFAPKLSTREAVKHTHHFILHKCVAPPDVDPDEYFGKFIGGGGDCYGGNSELVPSENCQNVLFVWATGGKPFLFPGHVGYYLNENLTSSEYLMLEIHYDNPDRLNNVTFETGVTVYHSSEKRQYQAEILTVAHDLQPSHVIPPQTKNYTTVGHCSPECTQGELPEGGIKIFNVLLHAHLSGRKLKLRHFRGSEELAWVSNDDNYNFDYQQNRPLANEILVLPGDQLSYECTADSSWTNGSVHAGFATTNEMCYSFSWYYPRQNLTQCMSSFSDFDKIYSRFGIKNVTYDYDYRNPTVTDPPSLINKTLSDVIDAYNWTDRLRKEFENELRYTPHYAACIGSEKKVNKLVKNNENDEGYPTVSYPKLDEEYEPPQEDCSSNGNKLVTFSLVLIISIGILPYFYKTYDGHFYF